MKHVAFIELFEKQHCLGCMVSTFETCTCMQAGARKVYAIEASKMANFAQKLFESNGEVGSRVQVMHGKVEALLDALPEKADILISEPMGTLLVNERMLETYILARKHFLKPGGLMFPGTGRVFVAAFADSVLHAELQSMASFWLNSSFYGVNLTSLHGDALEVCFQIILLYRKTVLHPCCIRMASVCCIQTCQYCVRNWL